MKNNKKKYDVKSYKKMVRRLTLSLITTIVIVVSVLCLITVVLRRIGINVFSMASPVIVTVMFYLLCAAIASFIAYFAMWNLFKPLQEISAASKKIASGDYSVRVAYNGKMQELADTIDNFNYMAGELSSLDMISNDFIANVSHEFKTPLSSLSGYLTLLQDDTLPSSERNEYISRTFFSIEKLNDLTDNILRLSKLENQSIISEPVKYRLDEQIRESIVILEPKWSKKNITFDLDLPEVIYNGQKALLFQVWTNLLSNAIKFSYDSGTITIRIEVTANHYKIYFIDNGIGISEEQQRHIFDKFYQADSSRKEQGNGLGLPLCKEIISRCNGKIYVRSSLEDGSVFLVSLRK